MPDFRSEYFLDQGATTPEFPPARFRLPDGSTRYSYDCSKEDLNLAGFEGPYPLPPLSGNETAEWNNDTKTWTVIPGGKVDPVFIDGKIRSYLRSILTSIFDAELPDASVEFLITLNNIKEEARKLLNSTELLTEASLKSFDLPALSTNSSLQAVYNREFSIKEQYWRYTYENYGWIEAPPAAVKSLFKAPADWVIKRAELQDQAIYSFPDTIYASGIFPSGAVLPIYASGSVVLSGYDPVYGLIITTDPLFL